MPLPNLNNQCTAKSKTTGNRCSNPAVIGYNVCYSHGAHKKKSSNDPPKKTKSGRHSNVLEKYKNKLNKTAEELGVDLSVGLKHGFLAFDILTPEERLNFLSVVKQMHEDFQLNKSSDFYATELIAMNLILLRRAVKNDDVKAAEAYDRMTRMHLNDLKATKSAREGDTVNVKTTPAEWAASILKKSREKDAGAKERLADVQENGTNEIENTNEHGKTVVFDASGDAEESDETKEWE